MRYGAKELLELYQIEDLSELAALANKIREEKNGNKVFYNKNFHVEPSNVCVHRCKFCSYRRDNEEQEGAWTMSISEIEQYCKEKYKEGMTEVHIVGSVNPSRDFDYYLNVIKTIRSNVADNVCIKCYSAVEIADMCKSAGLNLQDGIKLLREAGMGSIPGGGAEIFNPKIRNIICPDKITAEQWLEVHKEAHRQNIHTNATMLFGHIESREDRIDHLLRLRELQDQTHGFNAFIPLKFRAANNELGNDFCEASTIEVLKTFAISRIALDNIQHIKAYWPMLGKDLCQHALLFGADDIDGTINDTTKIYSMAGAEEKKPGLSKDELIDLAARAGYKAVERDSYYNIIFN